MLVSFNFIIWFSVNVHGAVARMCMMSVVFSSSVEGQGRDSMVSERHGCNNGPLWAMKVQGQMQNFLFPSRNQTGTSRKSPKSEQSDHWRKWNSTVTGELEKFLFAVAGEWVKSSIRMLRKGSRS